MPYAPSSLTVPLVAGNGKSMMQPRKRGFTMKYVTLIAALMILALPAQADRADASTRPVMAKTSPEQRALAQLIAGRIQGALDAEPFAADKDCKGAACTAAAH